MVMSGFLAANGIPLSPPLHTRLLALLVIEVALLLLVALLYVKWAQLKNQSLDEWWERRKKYGLSRQTLFEIEESDRKRRAAQGDAPSGPPGQDTGGTDAGTES
jgi:hypothetical protein